MEKEMPMVPMVSNTMMQVTSFVLSGIAWILRVKRLHSFPRFGNGREGRAGGEATEELGVAPADGGLESLIMMEG